ncbi:hypothetical protein Droror1_Dr00000686 [Drosera rotundifolia]
MKDDNHDHDHHRLKFHHKKRYPSVSYTTYVKPLSYVVLVVLSYTLGYYSATHRNKIMESVSIVTPISQPKPDITLTFDNLQPPSYDHDHDRFDTVCRPPVDPEQVQSLILDRIYNGTSPYENFPPAHITGLLRPNRIKGWGSNGAVFENLIRKVRPKTIIEVGTFLGASAIHMAGLASRFGLRSTQILCLDDFRGWTGFKDHMFLRSIPVINGDALLLYQFIQNVVQNGSTGSILPVPFSTGSGLENLCQWGVFGDLVEVDAGHDFHSAWADINRAYKVLRPGGVMFGHDYFTSADDHGVRRAVNLFARVKGLKVRADGQHWVIDSD